MQPGQRASVVCSVAVLVGLACGGDGPTPPEDPPSVPGRALPGTEHGWASALAPTHDGGYVLVGTRRPGPLGGSDVLLVRTDATGTVLWTAEYGGPGDEEGTSVQQTADGDLVLAGTTRDAALFGGPGGLLVVRTDARGGPRWLRTYAGPLPNLPEARAAVRERRGGGFVLVGTGPGLEPFNPEPDAHVLALDAHGAVLWQRTLGAEASNLYVQGHGVEVTADGGCVVVGQREGEAGHWAGLAVKLDAAGTLEWEQQLLVPSGPLYSAHELPGGAVVAVGRALEGGRCRPLLVRGDGLGGLVSQVALAVDTDCPAPVTGARTPEGLALAGTHAGDAFLARTDDTGGLRWAQDFGGNAHDFAAAVHQEPGGALVAVGGTASFGSTQAVYFLRVEPGPALR